MSEAPAYYGKADATGKLVVDCPALAGRYVVVRERKAIRSVEANRRYWALLTVAARELGYDDVEELHEGVALKLLPLPSLADGLPRRRRTPRLNTAEFSEYVDAVERFCRMELKLDLTDWDLALDHAPGPDGYP